MPMFRSGRGAAPGVIPTELRPRSHETAVLVMRLMKTTTRRTRRLYSRRAREHFDAFQCRPGHGSTAHRRAPVHKLVGNRINRRGSHHLVALGRRHVAQPHAGHLRRVFIDRAPGRAATSWHHVRLGHIAQQVRCPPVAELAGGGLAVIVAGDGDLAQCLGGGRLALRGLRQGQLPQTNGQHGCNQRVQGLGQGRTVP